MAEPSGDGTSSKSPVFPELNADALASDVTEIESLCTRCFKSGMTRLLLTKIPFYKDVVLMSFSCEHCHFENNELQPASVIQEKGIRYLLKVTSSDDLQRQVVKTEWASISIPELNFEIPSRTQEGTVTTIEGILLRAYDGIKSKKEEIEKYDPESGAKLEEFLKKLCDLKDGNSPFTFVLQDCSGNSFMESLKFGQNEVDTGFETTHFERTREESILLGVIAEEDDDEEAKPKEGKSCLESIKEEVVDIKDEILGFATNCPNCNAPCMTNMKLTNIPLFKDVVIMATVCDSCGHKTNEVKSGSGMEPQGIKYSLKIGCIQDLSRDILKSDTCNVRIPELELDIGSNALNSCYTTVEGLITNIKKQLIENNPFLIGDSAQPRLREKLNLFLHKLNEILEGHRPCTLVLDDPCGCSYLQSIYTEEKDENLTVEKYERTFDQNEELGLNDMKVENYEEL